MELVGVLVFAAGVGINILANGKSHLPGITLMFTGLALIFHKWVPWLQNLSF
jgi:hypothetical protein